ncbi:MAG: sulfite exporter TauE/SafE family protein [Candidatus Omnitrophica bacterium]|nr:sulfite exporter TauE/SafE family protein [Candidatus Omnitrophota bacterium]
MLLLPDSLDYLKAFLGGVGVSLTPCIYPLIPITAGYIGANSAGSKFKGFIFSLVYVTGIAVTYSILGILAALTGTIFGKFSAHPLTYLCVGIIIILFGLSMLDLITIPFFNAAKAHQQKKQSYLSMFLFGLSSGLVVSPCLSPVLGSILLYLATKKNLLYGATLLLSFAYGMGLILILIGTFSALLVNLPKSGRWMLYIKRFCAFVLLIIGLYFVFTGIRRLLL